MTKKRLVDGGHQCAGNACSVVATAIDTQTGKTVTRGRVPAHDVVLGWVAALPGPATVTYEGGPTGFGVARSFTAGRHPVCGGGTVEDGAASRGPSQDRREGRDAAAPRDPLLKALSTVKRTTNSTGACSGILSGKSAPILTHAGGYACVGSLVKRQFSACF